MSVPTHAALVAALGQPFLLGLPDGRSVEAHLSAAPSGVPMDDSYVCYSAVFELPAGVHLPQDVFRITAPGGDAWDLLVTPTAPVRGRATLTAVMHCLRSPEPVERAGGVQRAA
ncbi:DUF6916 family protein [Paraburkholderia phenazinium]|jgi:hypothetical protein|uniref:DUF6916 domain-containing protein n=1 Tax=Paraburkholderia phenazinium TaxID=60549 RepID=A0A1G7U6W6_9BURK|nr:hypothetical protein [Paraburkholderia phenazinium]SDG43362.1 hypothetical protein SAMN05216466_103332 [Paraburkholderia phenazinium]